MLILNDTPKINAHAITIEKYRNNVQRIDIFVYRKKAGKPNATDKKIYVALFFIVHL